MRGEVGLSLNPEEPAGKPGEDGGTEPREKGDSRGGGQLTAPVLQGARAGRGPAGSCRHSHRGTQTLWEQNADLSQLRSE